MYTAIAPDIQRPVLYAPMQRPGIEPSIGSVGDSYDTALAETITGGYTVEVIHRHAWRNLEAVQLATLNWIDWFNHARLLGPIRKARSGTPPRRNQQPFIVSNSVISPGRRDSHHRASGIAGAVQSGSSVPRFMIST